MSIKPETELERELVIIISDLVVENRKLKLIIEEKNKKFNVGTGGASGRNTTLEKYSEGGTGGVVDWRCGWRDS
jgi:hypothetical protein